MVTLIGQSFRTKLELHLVLISSLIRALDTRPVAVIRLYTTILLYKFNGMYSSQIYAL